MGAASDPLPTMNQQIFNAGLPMEAVSLYLLCCGLIDAGLSASPERIEARWNSSDDALGKSLQDLLERRILQKEETAEEGIVFIVTQPHEWR